MKIDPPDLPPELSPSLAIILATIQPQLVNIVSDLFLAINACAKNKDERQNMVFTAIGALMQHSFCFMNSTFPEEFETEQVQMKSYFMRLVNECIDGHLKHGPCSNPKRMVEEALTKEIQPVHDRPE